MLKLLSYFVSQERINIRSDFSWLARYMGHKDIFLSVRLAILVHKTYGPQRYFYICARLAILFGKL
jgi:hypothetical protein